MNMMTIAMINAANKIAAEKNNEEQNEERERCVVCDHELTDGDCVRCMSKEENEQTERNEINRLLRTMNKTKQLQLAQAEARKIGMSIRYLRDTEEYRVNFTIGGTEATSYYATDVQDALDTARAMRKQRDQQDATLRAIYAKADEQKRSK